MAILSITAVNLRLCDRVTLNGEYMGKLLGIRKVAAPLAQRDAESICTGDQDAERECIPDGLRVRKQEQEERGTYHRVGPTTQMVLAFGVYTPVNRSVSPDTIVEVSRLTADDLARYAA